VSLLLLLLLPSRRAQEISRLQVPLAVQCQNVPGSVCGSEPPALEVTPLKPDVFADGTSVRTSASLTAEHAAARAVVDDAAFFAPTSAAAAAEPSGPRNRAI